MTTNRRAQGVEIENEGSPAQADEVVWPRPRPVRKAKKSMSRTERSEEIAKAIFKAAFQVVGSEGYADAAVSKIAARAKVASGTFYNYFESRQDLFDQLLPTLGEQMLVSIRTACGDSTGIERERRRIAAYFEFCQKNPGFLRILNEAEIFAPLAFKEHFESMATGYMRALHRSRMRGEMPEIAEEEIEAMAHMLMGARSYLTYMWLATPPAQRQKRVDELVAAYVKLAERTLFKN